MNKFRVTLTEEDLNDLIYPHRDGLPRVVEKIYKAYHRGRKQKLMAHHRAWDRLSFYEKYVKYEFKIKVEDFNPTVPKLKGEP